MLASNLTRICSCDLLTGISCAKLRSVWKNGLVRVSATPLLMKLPQVGQVTALKSPGTRPKFTNLPRPAHSQADDVPTTGKQVETGVPWKAACVNPITDS